MISPGKEIEIQYHRLGKSRLAYRERLILDRSDVKVLFTEAADASVDIGGFPALERGAPIVWFVFPDQWSDVGRFHLFNGTFTGWYTNLCTPPVINSAVWSLTDLFLDLWIPAKGDPLWLDQEEFDHAAKTQLLDQTWTSLALAERSRITNLLAHQKWPPTICRDWDLQRVRRLC